jgi:hypothetical protein
MADYKRPTERGLEVFHFAFLLWAFALGFLVGSFWTGKELLKGNF